MRDIERIIEQAALLFASFVWTAIVLAMIVMFWAYKDVQARWEYVVNAPPDALAQAAPPTPTPQPSPTPWTGPGPTPTPTPPPPPTPTATRVVAPPEILPETFVPGDPTPVVVANLDSQIEPVDFNPQPPPPASDTPAPPLDQPQPASKPVPAVPAPPAETNPTRLVIEPVGIDSEIIPVGWSVVQRNGQEYAVWNVADYAVGWHKTSAPLGQPGNTVMAGHNNVNGEVFRDLVNVEVGDRIVAYAGDRKFEYEITFKTIVKEKGEPPEVRRRNAQWIAPTEDERLTLVTCWPYTSNTHRVIVVAEPI